MTTNHLISIDNSKQKHQRKALTPTNGITSTNPSERESE